MSEPGIKIPKIRQEEVGGLFVSTIKLWRDHSFGLGGDPLWYELMVFDRRSEGLKRKTSAAKAAIYEAWDQYQERFSTEQEAVARHQEIVAELRRKL